MGLLFEFAKSASVLSYCMFGRTLTAIIVYSLWLYALSTKHWLAISATICYFIWLWVDRDTCRKVGRHSKWLRQYSFYSLIGDYFPMKLHKTCDLNPDKCYIFATFPHGSACFSSIGVYSTDRTGFSSLFPGITPHHLTLDAMFWIPFIRDLCLGLGMGSVSAGSISYKLTRLGSGQGVNIAVGGVQEAKMADPNEPYQVKVSNRKGFIKMALRTG